MPVRALEAAAVLGIAGYVLLLAREARRLRRARAGLEAVVHVNGTRGKSETTRLLAAALREAGWPTLAKTTGTEPRLILEDGGERRWFRAGAANVREQRDFLLLAGRRGARAAVAECMAVSPDAQRASTAFLAPTVLVVTNVRPDHAAELGGAAETLAVFAEGIPPGGTVVTGDPAIAPDLDRLARLRGARLVLAEPCPEPGPWLAENAGTALAAAACLGVDRAVALAGMRRHRPDPGAFAVRRLPGTGVTVLDALAANDTVSTDLLFRRGEAGLPAPARRVLVLANRADRPDRSLAYARWAAADPDRWDAVLLAGRAGFRARRILGAAFPGPDLDGRPRLRALGRLADLAAQPPGTAVYATGNWRDLGPALAALAPALETSR
jgi:poly-gamma-glutamate synthase PgsB/CapB